MLGTRRESKLGGGEEYGKGMVRKKKMKKEGWFLVYIYLCSLFSQQQGSHYGNHVFTTHARFVNKETSLSDCINHIYIEI
jgi:hypothetical protein